MYKKINNKRSRMFESWISIHTIINLCQTIRISKHVSDSNPPTPPKGCICLWLWAASLLTMRGRVLIGVSVTSVSTPHGKQVEGQRPTSSREETRAVVPQGKVGTHYLHIEQHTYTRGHEQEQKECVNLKGWRFRTVGRRRFTSCSWT